MSDRVNCIVCGTEFKSKRKDNLTCSGACRSKKSRSKSKKQNVSLAKEKTLLVKEIVELKKKNEVQKSVIIQMYNGRPLEEAIIEMNMAHFKRTGYKFSEKELTKLRIELMSGE